ncbi:MAG: hypothetical protein ABSE49_26975 [Polyangiaceae bacterium]|jgi:hypothetical protein
MSGALERHSGVHRARRERAATEASDGPPAPSKEDVAAVLWPTGSVWALQIARLDPVFVA